MLTTAMTRLRRLAEWIWEQLERIHLLDWLIDLLGWRQLLVSGVAAILLTLKAASERLPTSQIILIGLAAFAGVLIVIDVALRVTKSKPSLEELPLPGAEAGEDMLEGTLELSMRGRTKVVFKRPFSRKPEVTLWRANNLPDIDPVIEERTQDYFTASVKNNQDMGEWHWRARGTLRRINKSV
jgi:hypothetical protein